jgi:hypothetical protein
VPPIHKYGAQSGKLLFNFFVNLFFLYSIEGSGGVDIFIMLDVFCHQPF